ncbi:MAG: trypsin-like peptidase domain-containing protein [Candidatus Sungbacteria bacterium]|nr:trypsin-like peptidase domain-containing protein [Candidatus Sungbacteria bacterium]
MDKLNRAQFLTLVCLAAFIAAAGGTVLTQSYLGSGGIYQLTPLNIFPKASPTDKEINERVLRQDELVVQSVAEVSPAVVSIVASKDVPIVEQEFVSPFPDDPFFQQFFGDQFKVPQLKQKGTQKQKVSSGTGFIVSSDGFILTNKHVVADTAAEYTVFMNDGTKLDAKVLARDPIQDFAIVKIEKTGLTAVRLGDSSKIKIGQTAIAIGNSLGEFRNTVSVGVVSGLSRSVTASGGGIGSEELIDLIQTDAAINPGNSGGPLLNLRGEVVGINTAIVQGAQNIGFSIPINKAKRDIESVKRTGKIIYPFVGVRYVSLNTDIQKQNNFPVSEGAWLKAGESEPAVVPGSPAEKAGLKTGDIIVEINGVKIDADHTLTSVLQDYAVGDMVKVVYLRNGARLTAPITLAERPSS